MATKPTVGIACIAFDKSFWGFRASQYRERVANLRDLGKTVGFKVDAVPKAFQDADGAKAAAARLNEKADLVILDVAAFPEGKAAGTFMDVIQPPLVLWGHDETEHGANIAHNSFCGVNFLAGNLALQGRRFRKLHGPLARAENRARLSTAVRLVAAAEASRNALIGLFGGGIVPKFFDIDILREDLDRLERRWNIRFTTVPTKALLRRANSYRAAEIEREAAAFAANFGRVEVPGEALLKQARLLSAIREIAAESEFAGAAVRCWPELQSLYGVWPCPVVAMLNETGVPTACEGDPGGALDMVLAARMSDAPSTLLDVVDWDDKADTFSIWHCGPSAPSWAPKGKTRLIPHNVDGATRDGKPAFGLPGVVDMEFRTGPVTVYRTLGAVDDEFAVEGRIVPAGRRAICGSFGAVGKARVYRTKLPVAQIRNQILDRALPHHFNAVRGHVFA